MRNLYINKGKQKLLEIIRFHKVLVFVEPKPIDYKPNKDKG